MEKYFLNNPSLEFLTRIHELKMNELNIVKLIKEVTYKPVGVVILSQFKFIRWIILEVDMNTTKRHGKISKENKNKNTMSV